MTHRDKHVTACESHGTWKVTEQRHGVDFPCGFARVVGLKLRSPASHSLPLPYRYPASHLSGFLFVSLVAWLWLWLFRKKCAWSCFIFRLCFEKWHPSGDTVYFLSTFISLWPLSDRKIWFDFLKCLPVSVILIDGALSVSVCQSCVCGSHWGRTLGSCCLREQLTWRLTPSSAALS